MTEMSDEQYFEMIMMYPKSHTLLEELRERYTIIYTKVDKGGYLDGGVLSFQDEAGNDCKISPSSYDSETISVVYRISMKIKRGEQE